MATIESVSSLMEMNVSKSFLPFEELETNEKEVLTDIERNILEQIVVFVMLPINVIGIITNLFNIRVFIEQGVKDDSTNISFVSLSLSDLLSCATLIPYCLCYVVKYTKGMPTHLNCIAFATQCLYVHVILQRCSAWITVYISLVRSLCVVIPLKVKLIFTPKVTVIVIIFIYVFFLMVSIPYIFLTEIAWVFDPLYNESIAYVFDTPSGREYLYYNTIFNNQVLSVVAIVIVSITTSLLVHRLFAVKRWRQNNASGVNNDSNRDERNSSEKNHQSSKDIEIVKSVTTVTSIFLICILMSYIPAIAMVILPGVNQSGINRNLLYVLYMVRFLFNAINASINFFFYIRISSRYKTAFTSSFKTCSRYNINRT